jgi:hypothetical protein
LLGSLLHVDDGDLLDSHIFATGGLSFNATFFVVAFHAVRCRGASSFAVAAVDRVTVVLLHWRRLLAMVFLSAEVVAVFGF